MTSFQRIILLALLSVLLSSCGFQLRGTANGGASLAHISPLYISGLDTRSDLYRSIRDSLQYAEAQVTTDRESATETLIIYNLRSDRRTHSVGTRGKTLEYELTEGFSFKLGRDRSKAEPSLANTLNARKVYTNPETETLGRRNEEDELWRDIRNQLAQQLVQRLSRQAK